MADAELKAAGDLAAEYVDKVFTSTVQGVHEAISGRAFGVLGENASAARVTHDTVSRGVYGAIRLGGQGLAGAIGAISKTVGGEDDARTISESRFGRATQAAVNGLIGDRLAAEGNDLAIEMSLRLPGRDLAIERGALADAFDPPRRRLVVFVHGLCEGEEGWWLGTRSDPENDGPAPKTYGQRLDEDLGFSPVYLRYNSGLHISENGRCLSWLLEKLRREWPLPVDEIAIVGHSMGGLVARSACQEAEEAGREWLRHVSHVVCLGAPNTGSWLEKVVHVGTGAMRRVPEVKPLADFFELRSDGIRDLRFGYVRDQDWALGEGEVDSEGLFDRSQPLAPVEGVEYHFVSSSLATGERHPLNSLFGDLLVRRESATGPRTADGQPIGDARHAEGVGHFQLLNSPPIYGYLHEWLGGER